jgi:hypothetical protein
MTNPLCVASRHGNDGTKATHMAAMMVWPTMLPYTDPKLRSFADAQTRKLTSVLVCASCQSLLAEGAATSAGNTLRTELKPKLPELKALFNNDAALNYSAAEWCFVGVPPDAPSASAGPPPPDAVSTETD